MKLSSVGKFLDQPLLTNTLSRKMPQILVGTAFAWGTYDTFKKPKEERKKTAIKNAIILTSITAASIIGAKGIKINGESLIEAIPKKNIIEKQTRAINKFIKQNELKNPEMLEILNRAKEKMLTLGQVDKLSEQMPKYKGAKELGDALFGAKNDINSKEVFGEIAKLSTMGAIPVASGILGGIAADKAVGEYTPEKTSNKVKEGVYQFLANIFMCNVGAGSFLYVAEKMSEKGVIKNLTPLKKTGVIMCGILCVGVLGGNKIANFIGEKVVNPLANKMICKGDKKCEKNERKPEALDVALHTDDIATAGVLSGLKWVEPLLPVMYLVSGYRSAIGYRNDDKNCAELDKTAVASS